MPRVYLNRNSIFGLSADSVRLVVAEAESRAGTRFPMRIDGKRWSHLALKNVDVPRSRDATSSWCEAVRCHKYGVLASSFSAVPWDHDPTAYDRNEFEASGSRLQWTTRRGMV